MTTDVSAHEGPISEPVAAGDGRGNPLSSVTVHTSQGSLAAQLLRPAEPGDDSLSPRHAQQPPAQAAPAPEPAFAGLASLFGALPIETAAAPAGTARSGGGSRYDGDFGEVISGLQAFTGGEPFAGTPTPGSGTTIPTGTGGGRSPLPFARATIPGGPAGGGADTGSSGGHTTGGGDTTTGGGDDTGSGGEDTTGGGNDTVIGGGEDTIGGGDTVIGGGDDTGTGGEDTGSGGEDTGSGGEDTTGGGGDDTPDGGHDTGTGGEDTTGGGGVLPDLFTVHPDSVDFNSVTAGSYRAGTQYDAGNQDDLVVLPENAAQAAAAGFAAGTRFLAGNGDDTVVGGGLADLIDGGNGQDLLFGGDGDDTLAGGTGLDTLFGGLGDDVMSGGQGKDSFGFSLSANEGNDVILDFVAGKGGDVLRFTDLVDVTGDGKLTVADLDAGGHSVSGHADAVVISLGSGTGITLAGLDGSGIDSFADLVKDAKVQIDFA